MIPFHRKENDELEDLSHRLYQQLEQANDLIKKGCLL